MIQLDPKTNILDAIMISDVLVSEESSTMCECVMMGKPAVSVCNWLIPDVTPSRFPADNYDFVVKTSKEQLTECVGEVLNHYANYAGEAKKYSDEHFANLGHCIPIMLDILDEVLKGEKCEAFRLRPRKRERVPASKMKYHIVETFKREVYYNYRERSKVVRIAWNFVRKVKRKITGR